MRRPRGRDMALAAVGIGAASLAATLILRGRFHFAGRTALITGGSRGLGLVLARHLAARGANVAVCARAGDELDRAGRDLASYARARTATFVCDVRDERRVSGMIDTIRSEWGPVDVLINAAGVISVGPLGTLTTEEVRESLDVHVMGPLHTMLAVLPDMLERREGRIVNISSIGGLVGIPHLAAYCAGKHALVGLSRSMQTEAARRGVRIVTVCPGLMRTGSPPRARFKGRHRGEYAWFSIGDSLPLVTMSADDAAERILAACRHGRAHVTLSVPAKVLAAMDALAPGVVSGGLAATNRLLPDEGGIGASWREGLESTSRWSPSLATTLTDRAALANNEVSEWPPRRG